MLRLCQMSMLGVMAKSRGETRESLTISSGKSMPTRAATAYLGLGVLVRYLATPLGDADARPAFHRSTLTDFVCTQSGL
jgi:hypothetical protein